MQCCHVTVNIERTGKQTLQAKSSVRDSRALINYYSLALPQKESYSSSEKGRVNKSVGSIARFRQ